MVWRDSWRTDGTVVVIAPGDVQDGLIRQATVLLFIERSTPEVTVSDSLGQRYRLDLPAHLLSSGNFTADTSCTLKVQPL